MNSIALKTIALGVVVALLSIASVMRFHHHKDDGSVCLCMSVECHSSHHNVDHDCNHHHSGDTDDDCGQNLDDFKDVQKQPDCAPSVSFVAIVASVLEINVFENLEHYFCESRPPLKWLSPIDFAVWRRGPPADFV